MKIVDVVSGPVVTSDFSKASSQASNLASEGIEIITNLKEMNGIDPNAPGTNKLFRLDLTGNCSGSGTTDINWDELFGVDISDVSCAAGSFGRVGYIINSCATDKSCISFKDSDEAFYANESVDTRTYKREVFIADTPKNYPLGATGPGSCAEFPNSCGRSNCNTDADLVTGDWRTIKQFAVVVSWTDSSGTHNQTQTACLQR